MYSNMFVDNAVLVGSITETPSPAQRIGKRLPLSSDVGKSDVDALLENAEFKTKFEELPQFNPDESGRYIFLATILLRSLRFNHFQNCKICIYFLGMVMWM